MSLPLLLSTSISTSKVRELGSIALAVRTSLPVNVSPGNSENVSCAVLPGNSYLGIDLGNVDVDTQDVDGRETKHLGAGTCIDQLPNINIAGSDHSAEGRINLFERIAALPAAEHSPGPT